MKKLQNNFTTPEQSKRLLELGVPEWTADMFYAVNSEKKYRSWEICPETIPFNTTYRKYLAYGENFDVFKHEYFYPCWSVGRLIEIFCICTDDRLSIEYLNGMQQTIIEKTIEAINGNKVDFSKLEE